MSIHREREDLTGVWKSSKGPGSKKGGGEKKKKENKKGKSVRQVPHQQQ